MPQSGVFKRCFLRYICKTNSCTVVCIQGSQKVNWKNNPMAETRIQVTALYVQLFSSIVACSTDGPNTRVPRNDHTENGLLHLQQCASRGGLLYESTACSQRVHENSEPSLPGWSCRQIRVKGSALVTASFTSFNSDILIICAYTRSEMCLTEQVTFY